MEVPHMTLMAVPDGQAGTVATLKMMVDLARQFRRDPYIRTLTAGLVRNLEAKNYTAEVDTVFNWVRDNVRYTLDINNVETIQWPTKTIELGYGDCDDMATLLASMLESIGHPARFAALAFEPGPAFDHVLVQTQVGNRWIPLDPTENNPIGWQPPGIDHYLIRNV